MNTDIEVWEMTELGIKYEMIAMSVEAYKKDYDDDATDAIDGVVPDSAVAMDSGVAMDGGVAGEGGIVVDNEDKDEDDDDTQYYPPEEEENLMKEINTKFGIIVSKSTCYKARAHARELIRGSIEDHYYLLAVSKLIIDMLEDIRIAIMSKIVEKRDKCLASTDEIYPRRLKLEQTCAYESTVDVEDRPNCCDESINGVCASMWVDLCLCLCLSLSELLYLCPNPSVFVRGLVPLSELLSLSLIYRYNAWTARERASSIKPRTPSEPSLSYRKTLPSKRLPNLSSTTHQANTILNRSMQPHLNCKSPLQFSVEKKQRGIESDLQKGQSERQKKEGKCGNGQEGRRWGEKRQTWQMGGPHAGTCKQRYEFNVPHVSFRQFWTES
ncbi:hypothetical protein CRG98_020737 [Punica granatum]|uniref:Uncharacterized protein n=1 Tax=Punica granatum TaxID=22663 RepID=A0A2I0JRB3_PUNGR|nr:hypothetical protein CRG98_020737 [Punica granatum]